MAFKRQGVAPDVTKFYLWQWHEGGGGVATWYYVSADTPAVIEQAGYFSDEEALLTFKEGDRIVAYQVGAIVDTRSIQADIAAGLTTMSEHIVLVNDGSSINISPALVGLSVEYSLP